MKLSPGQEDQLDLIVADYEEQQRKDAETQRLILEMLDMMAADYYAKHPKDINPKDSERDLFLRCST